ncbi:hypothetical protein D0Z07_2977 [Hyphodiscus hymeniophilus]|uniref:Uncharacterized protein n=1 Tax=Hyphodiscus hymeniophilus TaxID=353542 RepID=A0A9P6VMB7_9HELO|nr:hypothetical protein D0Z07_2977 [Hyphodiscus hymeniophilus]
MSEKLVPKNPEEVMVIRDVLPGITTFSVPFSRFGLIKVGGRGTVVDSETHIRLPRRLLPRRPDTLRPRETPIPRRRRILHRSARHRTPHLPLLLGGGLPQAHIIGPEGLAEKRAQMNAKDKRVTNVPFSTIFTKANNGTVRVSEEFDRDFEYEFVAAHQNKELVFFHKPSKTLIEADLMFNLPATEQYSRAGVDATTGVFTRLFGGIQNTRGSAIWQKRVLWYALSSSDRNGFNASVKRINGWGFENVVPCHGDVIVGGGKGIFEKVFEWHLQGKK